MNRSVIGIAMVWLAAAGTGCGKTLEDLLEDMTEEIPTAGTDTDGVYESVAEWTTVAGDSTLGYNAYPEAPGTNTGTACRVEIPVNTPEGTAFHIRSTTLSGSATEPGMVGITPPTTTGLTSDATNPAAGWSAVTHHFDGQQTPVGTWVATMPFPDPYYLETHAAEPELLAQECQATYGEVVLTFDWSEEPAPHPLPPGSGAGQHCQPGSATSKLLPWRAHDGNKLSSFPWVMSGSQGAVGHARITSVRVTSPGHASTVSIMAVDGTRVFVPMSGNWRTMERTAWVGGDWLLEMVNVAGSAVQLPEIEYSWTCVADPGSFGRTKPYLLTVPDFAQQIIVRVEQNLEGHPVLMFEPRGRPERADSVLITPAGANRYTVDARLRGFDMAGVVEVRPTGLRLDGTFGPTARAIHQTLPPLNQD